MAVSDIFPILVHAAIHLVFLPKIPKTALPTILRILFIKNAKYIAIDAIFTL
jgi:hypothetical protein